MTRRPNIVFIVADDLGFADLGCYGGRVPVSPVLDRMAAEGIRFRHGYANSPVCSPTRFALAGKWHLGYPPAFGPLRSGYDEFFGPMSGGVDYFSHCDFRGAHDLFEGDAEHREEGYLTDLISRRAVDFIERTASRDGAPFFLSVHYTAPHWPWETRDDAALAAEVKENLFHLHGAT